jgi:hypothetical protein
LKKHQGEIIEQAIRKSGIPMTRIAKGLGISRNTLYNRFGEIELEYDFLKRLGEVIHYDFALTFPELKHELNAPTDGHGPYIAKETFYLLNLHKKYTQLLERHNELLRILTKVANNN